MDKIKQKQLEQLRQLLAKKQQRFKQSLKNLIVGQQIHNILNYSHNILVEGNLNNLNQYSPIHISRLIFQQQLKQIQQYFVKLPDQCCRQEHFLVIMLKVMKFPFEETAHYLIGLKDMFKEIADKDSNEINYGMLSKYVLGELVSLKQEQMNTEFQVNFSERKKQDYLLHDNGIKQLYYSKDLKMVLSLDQKSQTIKMYDYQMKLIRKFSPNKDKHQKRYPIIHSFDYSQMTMKLGMVLADETISIVHLGNYLNKSESQFESGWLNEVVYNLQRKMLQIVYIQMMNKWATISQDNKLFLIDMEKIRHPNDNIVQKIKLDNDLAILQILQIVPLSAVTIIAGHEIIFLNENMTEKKFKKFSHCEIITILKYSDEKNQFYFCGRSQKLITILSLNRTGTHFKIHTFETNKIIINFDIFPYLGTIIIVDQNHDLKLYQQKQKICYQINSYTHIVKGKQKILKIKKISKNQFIIFQTYMLVFNQQKVAIQQDAQFNYQPYMYFDEYKKQLYLSVNNQILSLSIFYGEIRKSYGIDTSNLVRHEAYFIGDKTHLFILDINKDLMQVYQRDENLDGQNKTYKKKLGIQEVIKCFYDETFHNLLIAGHNTIYQVRNDSNNNFTVRSLLILQKFQRIQAATFCPHSKIITLSNQYNIYQLHSADYQLIRAVTYSFKKDTQQHEERLMIDYEYDHKYGIDILLTNKNQLYFISVINPIQQLYFNLQPFLPSKIKMLKFRKMKYQYAQIQSHKSAEPFIFLTNDTGFLVEITLKKQLDQYLETIKKPLTQVRPMCKDTHKLHKNSIKVKNYQLSQSKQIIASKKNTKILKAHEKQISLVLKIKVESFLIITLSVDGSIKLWSAQLVCLFNLKMPNLTKITWNMSSIQQIKYKRSIKQVLELFNSFSEHLQEKKIPTREIVKKAKLEKNKSNYRKINMDEPILLEFDNKQLQTFVTNQPKYHTYYTHKKTNRKSLLSTDRVMPHPWRRKKQFLKIYDKASPNNKYKDKMPLDLLAERKSLDMAQKRRKQNPQQQKLHILPQLNTYEPEKKNQVVIKKKERSSFFYEDEQNNDKFESCLYIKSQRGGKIIDELDEIDKQFKRKQINSTGKKWIPNHQKSKKQKSTQLKPQVIYLPAKEPKKDPISAIKDIFQAHNREFNSTKKGRFIRIPKIGIKQEQSINSIETLKSLMTEQQNDQNKFSPFIIKHNARMPYRTPIRKASQCSERDSKNRSRKQVKTITSEIVYRTAEQQKRNLTTKAQLQNTQIKQTSQEIQNIKSHDDFFSLQEKSVTLQKGISDGIVNEKQLDLEFSFNQINHSAEEEDQIE